MYNFVFFFYLVIFFIFVRWDILNSVHTFNLVSVFENYINYICILGLTFLTIYLLFLIFIYKQLKIKYNYLKKINKLAYINFGLNFIINLILAFFFFNVWITLTRQSEQNESVFFLRFFLIFIIFLVNINLNKKNLYYIYLILFFLKNFINIVFFLGINTFIVKKLNWRIKLIHIGVLISILVYNYCNDFQFFNPLDDNNYLINISYILKNNLLIIIKSFYEEINISNNISNFNENLLTTIGFFNIKSEIYSFSAKTQLEHFHLKTYNYFLFSFWVCIFILFLNIVFLFYFNKKHLNSIY